MTHPLRAGLEEAIRISRECDRHWGTVRITSLLCSRLAALPEVEPSAVTDEMVGRALDVWKSKSPGTAAGDWMRSALTAALSVQAKEEDAKPFLWCCHVRGPDEVHAAPDYETALKWADMVNGLVAEANARIPEDQRPMTNAVPAPWPWSAKAHAENLPKSIRGFSLPAKIQDFVNPSPPKGGGTP